MVSVPLGLTSTDASIHVLSGADDEKILNSKVLMQLYIALRQANKCWRKTTTLSERMNAHIIHITRAYIESHLTSNTAAAQ